MNFFKKTAGFFREAFKGVTFKEMRGAVVDTTRDILSSRREALTFIAFNFFMPTPSGLLYLTYRLRQHRARIGVIDAKPDPLLSDEHVAAIKARIGKVTKSIAAAPAAGLRFLRRLLPATMKTAGMAVALGSTGVAGYAVVEAFRKPVILDYPQLKACNDALSRGLSCTVAGAAEKSKSRQAIALTTTFGLALGGIGAGALMASAAPRRKKPKAG